MSYVKIFLRAILVALACGCTVRHTGPNVVEASDNVVTKQIELGDFSRIDASRVNVVYTLGQPGTATLMAPDNEIDHVELSCRGGKLEVSVDDDYAFAGGVRAVLTVSSTSLAEVEAALTANVAIDKAVCTELELEASTAACIHIGEVTATKIDAAASTAGQIEINGGTADRVDLEASTAGKIVCRATFAGGTAEASTSGHITTHVDSLTSRSLATGGSIEGL